MMECNMKMAEEVISLPEFYWYNMVSKSKSNSIQIFFNLDEYIFCIYDTMIVLKLVLN